MPRMNQTFFALSLDSTRPAAVAEIKAAYQVLGSLELVARRFDMHWRTLYRWADRWPEVAAALEIERVR